ncbi:DegT/DnrJ/EryC1/StrS aminotransferase [Acidovorax sp. NO-1]|nr:DegT/DnrJ/EryC1/StrS aminotransferase [Acidovorax sp. NO-1]
MSQMLLVPFFSTEYANANASVEDAIRRVVRSNHFILGREVSAFEDEFAAYIGVEHCVTVASGSDALELALRALGVNRGQSVVTVANAGFYGSFAIHALGAEPLYVDVDRTTLTLSVQALEEALRLRPAAVIVTHLYGQMANMGAIADLCSAACVPLVEDCAQSHGASLGGHKAGAWGDVSCFSFYPTKNLGALGDGGCVVTRRADLALGVRALRQYGWEPKYTVVHPHGCNSRMDEIQAAVLRAKLRYLDACNAERSRIAARYAETLADLPLVLPGTGGPEHVAHLYVVQTPARDALRAHLAAVGIAAEVHYPVADHHQPAYLGTPTPLDLAVTEQACAQVLSLPCFPGMSDDAVAHVAQSVRRFFVKGG